MTAPVGNTNNTNNTNQTDNTDDTTTKSNSDLGESDFLNLLVAQLKYQDPSSPTDPSQFIAQTAQFTQVESLNTLNTTVSNLVKTEGMSTATAMLGRTVQFTDNTGQARTGMVTTASVDSDGVELGIGAYKAALSDVTEVKASATSTGPFDDKTSIAM